MSEPLNRPTREQVEEFLQPYVVGVPQEFFDTQRLARAYLALLDECDSLRKDKERLEWWLLHCSATVMVNRGKYAVYFGPQPSTKWFNTPREAIDAARESK